MTEQTRATLGTITVVAGLALIGYLAYLRVEAAAIAAPSIVIALVSWFTRAPERKDPPTGTTLVPLFAAGAVIASLFACGCSTPPVELPVVSVETKQKAAGATFGADLLECVDNNKKHEAAIDACADAVRRFWGRKDGGS
ncbi:MAG TPA: hypothetical protein VFN70_18135 [Burkholderiales bacterium]|nr:hypothetical protein [Burkholderiales bacterium]